jgi:hypothetical protein
MLHSSTTPTKALDINHNRVEHRGAHSRRQEGCSAVAPLLRSMVRHDSEVPQNGDVCARAGRVWDVNARRVESDLVYRALTA